MGQGKRRLSRETTAALAVREAVDSASDGVRARKPNPKRVELRRLKPRHHTLMVALLSGETETEAARLAGMTPNRASIVVNSRVFRDLYRKLEAERYRKIVEGDYGPIALARTESHGAMRRLIAISKKAKSEETQRKAINDVLALAGFAPVKKVETLSLDDLFNRMTDDELAHFANTGEWPARLGDALQQLGRDVKIAAREEAIDAEFEEVPDDEPDDDDAVADTDP